MELEGAKSIAKISWRHRVAIVYQMVSGNRSLPWNEKFFTLGGPVSRQRKLISGCELDTLMRFSDSGKRFLYPHQYVSVERNAKTYAENQKLCIEGYTTQPIFYRGDFAKNLASWNNWNHIGIVNADLMCGVDVALPTIRLMTGLNKTNHKVLYAINILAKMNLRGKKINSDVLRTIRKDAVMASRFRKGEIRLIDRYSYNNQTVGLGANKSTMETIFLWG